jgi:hypothetical protein
MTITQNIRKFRDDAERVWVNLIDKYIVEEMQIGRLIAKLEDPKGLIYRNLDLEISQL